MKQNYYGDLCSQMAEILCPPAKEEELSFYLSAVQEGDCILEPFCGSGRFTVEFMKRGFSVTGVDNSPYMLEALKKKAENAVFEKSDILDYDPGVQYDAILIPADSVSLFTEKPKLKKLLIRLRNLLKPGGKLLFSVKGFGCRLSDDEHFTVLHEMDTGDGEHLLVRQKNGFDDNANIQYSPAFFELYEGELLLQSEPMDLQYRLYHPGEMVNYLKKVGFADIKEYVSFDRRESEGGDVRRLLYECSRPEA